MVKPDWQRASIVFVVASMFLVGCDEYKKAKVAVLDAGLMVQQTIDELKKGNKTFSDIKTLLEGLKGNLDNGEYKSQVDSTIARAVQAFQVGGESYVDFLRNRVIEDLESLKATVTGKDPPPRIPILASTEIAAVDFESSSRKSVTVIGWNLDVAQKDQKKYYVAIENAQDGRRNADWARISYNGQYAVTVDVSQSTGILKHHDNKIVFVGFDPAFEISVIKSIPAPPPPAPVIVQAIIGVKTTNNDKDREVHFVYTVHLDGVGARHDATHAYGAGEVWPDPSYREFTIKLDRPIPEADRQNYQLRVRYESSDGDPNWIGRVSVRGKTADGREIPLLGETGDFEMGHHDDGKKTERVQREFKFNQ